jgi:hypothetical protein
MDTKSRLHSSFGWKGAAGYKPNLVEINIELVVGYIVTCNCLFPPDPRTRTTNRKASACTPHVHDRLSFQHVWRISRVSTTHSHTTDNILVTVAAAIPILRRKQAFEKSAVKNEENDMLQDII